MKYILSLIISGALVVSGFGQTRNVLVGTNNAVVQPTNFWSADASSARTGLGLGTAATNPATAFQPSSVILSNLSASNGGGLTNLNATNVVGTIGVSQGGTGSTNTSDARIALGLGTASTNPATAFQSSSINLSNLASGDGGSLANLQATNLVGIIPASNISTVTFTNISGTLSIASGGTGATNASTARQNLGSTTVGDAVFVATNAEAARTAIGSGPSDSITLSNLTLGSLSGGTLIVGANSGGQIVKPSLLSVAATTYFIGNVGSVLTNWTAATARTNLELGWSALTNTDATSFRNAIGLGTTNNVVFGTVASGSDTGINGSYIEFGGTDVINTEELRLIGNWQVEGSFGFNGTNIPLFQAQSRTNLGLPWSGLTNTNAATFQTALFGANTNPVLVGTNGEVVSPTNFWQAAPITTTFIESQPTTNFTTNITAARFLHIHSLNTNIVNVTNTIALPTNGATFNGDIALVVHQGPTNSMTRVRTIGSTNDIATMTRYNEAIEFVYYNNVWQFNHNEAFTEPIYFAGTNAAVHVAESRTNLGLGWNGLTNTNASGFRSALELSASWLTNTNASNFLAAIGLGETNSVSIGNDGGSITTDDLNAGNVNVSAAVTFTTNTAAALTRTNLGIPLAALTNTTVTNFQKAIFYTNTAPSNIGGNLGTIAAWIEIVASNGVTYKIPAYTNVP